MAHDQRIPRTSAERIDVDARARARYMRQGRSGSVPVDAGCLNGPAHASIGALTGSHHKPPVRWPTIFTGIFEKVVLEVDRYRVVFEQSFAAMMLQIQTKITDWNQAVCVAARANNPNITHIAISTVEDVQRTVVGGAAHIFHVIFHLHLHAVAFIVLAAFELLISVLFR